MNEDEVKELIENAIYLNFQFEIKYTNSRGETSEYDILKITSTSEKNFTCIADPKGGKEKRPFYKFRCDRISSLELTNEGLHTHDFLIDKIRNNELFTSDDFVNILGGTKTSGYVSSVNPISKLPPKITKKEAEDLLNKINLPIISGWSRGVIFNIKDADTYEILKESDAKNIYTTRLFGVDAPESDENSPEYLLALQATVNVEEKFKDSRYCYFKEHGKDTYNRFLMEIKNSKDLNIGLELLRNGLGIPMMGYFQDDEYITLYEEITKEAFENRRGVWSIQEIYERYNNIVSDRSRSEIDIMQYIPDKKTAFGRYLKQNPKAKIVKLAIDKKKNTEKSKIKAESIYKIMTEGIQQGASNLDSLKEMCEKYQSEITKLENDNSSKKLVRECIMYIEELVDKLQLGNGDIKGNFSKGKNKLIYHDNPETRWYKLCIPEISFISVKDAKYCGFKKA